MGPAGASPRLSSQQLREWLVQRAHRRSGAPGAGEPGDTGAGGAADTTGARDPTELGAAGAGGAGAGVAGVGGPGAGGAGAVDPGAGGAGGTVRPRPYFVPLLQQVLGVPCSTGLPPPFPCPPPNQSQPPLQPASPLPIPSPYTEQSRGLTVRREPASRPVLPVRTAPRAPRSRPPPVPGTHAMALRPSSVLLRFPPPAPPKSSLPEVPDPESDRARAASPTVTSLLAAAVIDPSFESAAASALIAELLDFAAACRLDYASALVAESVLVSPPSVGGEFAVGTDVIEDKQEDFECLAAAVPRFVSLLLAPEGEPDAPDIPIPRSYAEAITGPYSRYIGHGACAWRTGSIGHADTSWVDDSATQRSSQGYTFSLGSDSVSWRSTRFTSGMGLVLGGRGPVVLTGHADASWVDDLATQWSSLGYTFSLGSGSASCRSTHSSSVLRSSCEAEIYTGAMAAQELRWLTYLLTDLGDWPHSPPVLYVDKAMIALCQEHGREHRTKHIALRYFLARELQQRGQLRLAYVPTRANTADIFAL
ncbi:unnamed protein product [Closterium sp. NIES-53]